MDYLEFVDVKKEYKVGDIVIHALNGVSFSAKKGSFTVIAGSSGAGKSTLLNILGGMDTLSSGQFFVDDNEISSYSQRKLTTYRRNDIGFVFQFYNLVPNLNALENVELATEICKEHSDPRLVLEQVGLGERMYNFPAQLSGGEQQRVAIARALAKKPKLLICDEPTGALDSVTGKTILKLLQDNCKNTGMTVVVVTHNMAVTPIGDLVVKLKNGLVKEITANPSPVSVEEIEW